MNFSFGKPARLQAGLSLVELMVALLISTLLLLGVLELFGSSSQTERSANALARLQENGRLVMDLIAREARRSGFYGCDVQPGSSDEEDFPDGKISNFPAESLKNSTDNSLTFHYFGTGDGAITTDGCEREKLGKYYISFKNCSSTKNGICVESGIAGKCSEDDKKKDICGESKGKEQVLLNNGKIEKVLYMQPCMEGDKEGQTCSYAVGNLPKLDGSPGFKDVSKLQVTLKLCTDEKSESSKDYCADKSKTKLERTFSTLIELRNRQQ